MNVADFKNTLNMLKNEELQSTVATKINISTLNVDNKYNIQNHTLQDTRYKVDYSFYNSLDDFNSTPSVSDGVKQLMPKMFSWKNAEADYYIWLDGSLRLATNQAVNWMMMHLNYESNDTDLVLFKHPTRSNIIEEVDYIESEINKGNEQMIARYNLDVLKSQVSRYLKEMPHMKTFPLPDTRAFLYSNDLIGSIYRKWSNFMYDWFCHTVTESMNDKISLMYVIHYSGIKFEGFSETLDTCSYINTRI